VLPDEASGQGPGALAEKLSRCKEGMAHFLPSFSLRSLGEGGPGTNLVECWRDRGTIYLGARNLSRYRILIACRCALCPTKHCEVGCPGARTITNLSREQEQKPARTTLPE